jgi:Sulfotransferase family
MKAPARAGRRLLVRVAARALPPLGRLIRQRDELERQVARLRLQREGLQERNARLREAKSAVRAELRQARVGQRGRHRVGDRDDLRFLFIVTYGRSGSTLLQGIISSIPGYLIRGENGGAVYNLYRFHATASRQRAARSAGWRRPENAWFGIGGYPNRLALSELRRVIIATLIRPERSSRVVGFKEIRWLQTDLHEYVDFLRAAFPGARFVINTRNLDDVVSSKWWARREGSRELLAEAEERMLALKERLGDDAYHVHYDDYVERPGRLRGLFDWLGEEFDEARVEEVMARKHSY